MTGDKKLVDFYIWCPSCKHYTKLGTEEPCNECLETPAREDSHKPEKWEAKE